jgi:hypothetical protein
VCLWFKLGSKPSYPYLEHHGPAMTPWAGDLIFLFLRLLFCKMGGSNKT